MARYPLKDRVRALWLIPADTGSINTTKIADPFQEAMSRNVGSSVNEMVVELAERFQIPTQKWTHRQEG